MASRDYYLIFRCINTLELTFAARKEGIPVWAAIKKIRRPHGVGGKPVVVDECVLPGYVFVRGDGVAAFRRWCPKKYFPQVLTMPTAPPGTKASDWDASRVPVRLAADRLEQFLASLQQACSPTEAATPPEILYRRGDLVDVVYHPLFPDLFGCVVERGRVDGTLRLRTPSGTVLNIHKSCVQPKNRG